LIGGLAAISLPDASAAGNGRDGKFAPETGLYFGLWNRNGDMTKANIQANVTARETQLGRKLDIDHHFYDFTDTFPGWKETWDIQNGRTPLIAWSVVDTLQVNAGQWDSVIRARAQGIKALNHPVFLRWFWEPEWKSRNALTNGYAEYQTAWRRIHNIFQQEGATNTAFVYCATAWGFVSGEAQKYYPGDAYVDWVCSDGYNWAPNKPGSTWASFDKIFRPTHDFAVAHNKPMMGGEIGVQEGTAGQKAAWFNDARNVIKASYPNLAAFVYFDENRIALGGYDWVLHSSTSALNAWVAMGRDPYFSPGGVPDPTTVPPTTSGPTTAPPTTAPPTTTPPTTMPPTTTTVAPPPPPPGVLFSDGFESGDFGAWNANRRATVSTSHKTAGSYGAVVTATAGGAYLSATLASQASVVTLDLQLKILQTPNLNTPVARLIGTDGAPMAAVVVDPKGQIILRDPVTGTKVSTGVSISANAWHRLVVVANTQTGGVVVTLDGGATAAVSGATWAGPSIRSIELGDYGGKNPAKAYSFAYDAVTVT
jgi:beta-mannanase